MEKTQNVRKGYVLFVVLGVFLGVDKAGSLEISGEKHAYTVIMNRCAYCNPALERIRGSRATQACVKNPFGSYGFGLQYFKVLRRFSLKTIRSVSYVMGSHPPFKSNFLKKGFLYDTHKKANLKGFQKFVFPYTSKIWVDIHAQSITRWSLICQRMKFLKDITMRFPERESWENKQKKNKYLENTVLHSVKNLRQLQSLQTQYLAHYASEDLLKELNDRLLKCSHLKSMRHFSHSPERVFHWGWDFERTTKHLIKAIKNPNASKLQKMSLEFCYPSPDTMRELCHILPQYCPHINFLEAVLSNNFPSEQTADVMHVICKTVQSYHPRPFFKVVCDRSVTRELCGVSSGLLGDGGWNWKLEIMKKLMGVLETSNIDALSFKMELGDRGIIRKETIVTPQKMAYLNSLVLLKIPCLFHKIVNCKTENLRCLKVKSPRIFDNEALMSLKHLGCSKLEEFSLTGSAAISQEDLDHLFKWLEEFPLQKIGIEPTLFFTQDLSKTVYPKQCTLPFYNLKLLEGLSPALKVLDVPVCLEEFKKVLENFSYLRRVQVAVTQAACETYQAKEFKIIMGALLEFPKISEIVLYVEESFGSEESTERAKETSAITYTNLLSFIKNANCFGKQVFLQTRKAASYGAEPVLPVFKIVSFGPFPSLPRENK